MQSHTAGLFYDMSVIRSHWVTVSMKIACALLDEQIKPLMNPQISRWYHFIILSHSERLKAWSHSSSQAALRNKALWDSQSFDWGDGNVLAKHPEPRWNDCWIFINCFIDRFSSRAASLQFWLLNLLIRFLCIHKLCKEEKSVKSVDSLSKHSNTGGNLRWKHFPLTCDTCDVCLLIFNAFARPEMNIVNHANDVKAIELWIIVISSRLTIIVMWNSPQAGGILSLPFIIILRRGSKALNVVRCMQS